MANIQDVQTIVVMNGGQVMVDAQMLAACLAKVAQQIVNAPWYTVSIVVSARKPDGWLEYAITFRQGDRNSGTSYYIAAIQRTVGAEIEFHS